MTTASRKTMLSALLLVLTIFAVSSEIAAAQTCQTSSELDDATRNAITGAAQRYFAMAARGDSASLRQNAIPSLAADFAGVENTLKDRQQDLAGAQSTVKSSFLLDAGGVAPNPHAEFYCGVFGKNGQTANSAAFYLDNLPPGKYAVVLLDATSPKGRTMFTEVLQQTGTDWKLGGLYIKPAQVGGHDSDWFLARANEYKSKGELHNAWFYFLEARSLISPLPFMSTLQTDKLFDQAQAAQPADMPAAGKTADLVTPGATYKLIAVYPDVVGNDMDLIVKYQSANVSNTTVAYQDNVNVMKALVTKYPELRDAFASVVARAVDTSGRDYGTLLAMKDIK
ncbi:MAG TPA: hypothetical protein VKQ11_14050 [Candidatus Sulfotelmatobacter sp.]|nr:hypothetical protein [Candidatus Sulfotelmatobacter sp.]